MGKPTHAPGEYMNVVWETYSAVPDQEQVYGHVDEDTFWDSVLERRLFEHEKPIYRAMFQAPYHTFVRVVRADESMRDDGYETALLFNCAAKRGAAPVTVALLKPGLTYHDQNDGYWEACKAAKAALPVLAFCVDSGAERFWFAGRCEADVHNGWLKMCDEWDIAQDERAATIRPCTAEEMDTVMITNDDGGPSETLSRALEKTTEAAPVPMDSAVFIAGTVW